MSVYDDGVVDWFAARFETAMGFMKIPTVQDTRLLARASTFGDEKRILFFIERGPNLLNDRLLDFFQGIFRYLGAGIKEVQGTMQVTDRRLIALLPRNPGCIRVIFRVPKSVVVI